MLNMETEGPPSGAAPLPLAPGPGPLPAPDRDVLDSARARLAGAGNRPATAQPGPCAVQHVAIGCWQRAGAGGEGKGRRAGRRALGFHVEHG